MKSIILWIVSCQLVLAGQSMLLNNTIINTSVPNTPTSQVEGYLHDWSNSAVTHVLRPDNVGTSDSNGWLIDITITGTNTQLVIRNNREGTCLSSACGTGFILNGLGNTLPTQAVYFRAQEDVVNLTAKVEAWDSNGVRVGFLQWNYATFGSTGAGFQVGSNDLGSPSSALGWVRIKSTLLPLNSRPPTTVDNTTRVLEWKLDGTLVDASGNGYTATVKAGFSSPSYVTTPYQIAVSVIKTGGAPSWSNIISMRAGGPATLDGTASLSQSDSSNTVTCLWKQLSGPSRAFLSSYTSCTPKVTGLVFGDYQWQLTVADPTPQTAVSTVHIGAVSTDTNGVVVNSNPLIGALLGDQIAFGKNPWGYQDNWQMNALGLRTAAYTSSKWANLQWEQTPATGSVWYWWMGIGQSLGNTTTTPKGTTIGTGGITSTALTIPVADSTQIDTSDLPTPTRVLLFAGTSPGASDAHEEVRICAVPDSTHLTVCYDGRGSSQWGQWTGSAVNMSGVPQSWPAGTTVAQFKLSGTSTHFISDTVAICPTGSGPPGPSRFTPAGTVTLTANSATVTSSGTNWLGLTVGDSGTNSGSSYFKVSATHSGTPFSFVATIITGGAQAFASVSAGVITAVSPFGSGTFGINYTSGAVDVIITDQQGNGSGATATANVVAGQVTTYTVTNGGTLYVSPLITIQPRTIVLSRVFPADADTGTYSTFSILKGERTVILRAPHTVDTDPTHLGSVFWGTNACESETSAYLNGNFFTNSLAAGHDNGTYNHQCLGSGCAGGTLTLPYSVTDTTGYVNGGAQGGISFYNEGWASLGLWARSGIDAAKNAWHVIDDHLANSPWMNPSSQGWPPLVIGGPVIGGITDAVLGGPTDWTTLRDFVGAGETMANNFYNGGSFNCEFADTRNGGYAFTWLFMGALYDPDNTFRTRWQGDLAHAVAADQACAGTDYSWSNTLATWNFGTGPFAFTNGSTAGTAASVPAQVCTGTASGTGTISNGSGSMTVSTGTIPGTSDGITITGPSSVFGVTMCGTPFNTSNSAFSTMSVTCTPKTGSVLVVVSATATNQTVADNHSDTFTAMSTPNGASFFGGPSNFPNWGQGFVNNVWIVQSAVGGSTTVTVSNVGGANSAYGYMYIVQVTGAATSSVFDCGSAKSSHNDPVGPRNTGACTTTVTGDLLLALSDQYSFSSGPQAILPQRQVYQSFYNGLFTWGDPAVIYSVAGAPGSYSMNTFSDNEGDNIFIALKPLAGTTFTGSYNIANAGGPGTPIVLSALWTGYTGTVNWMSNNTSGTGVAMTAYGTGPTDHTDLGNSYNCIWNSSSSITLDHPWQGATSSGGTPNFWGWETGNISGYGQQPYYVGIKTLGSNYLAKCTTDATYASLVPGCAAAAVLSASAAYVPIRDGGIEYLRKDGINPYNLGTNYGTGYGYCGPLGDSNIFQTNTNSTSSDLAPKCSQTNLVTGAPYAREQNQELGNSLALFAEIHPDPYNTAFVDQTYGGIWGNPPYNTGGVFSDSNSTALYGLNLSDAAVSAGKWYGFFCGMGLCARWPASRVGGLAPAVLRTVTWPFYLATVPTASEVAMTVTQPSGAVSNTITCTVSPCVLTTLFDARQGMHLVTMEYRNSSHATLRPAPAIPFPVQ